MEGEKEEVSSDSGSYLNSNSNSSSESSSNGDAGDSSEDTTSKKHEVKYVVVDEADRFDALANDLSQALKAKDEATRLCNTHVKFVEDMLTESERMKSAYKAERKHARYATSASKKVTNDLLLACQSLQKHEG
ncbi:hypothetical protein NE237_028626 [Protea cynaroides]|uniref:Uncharacterized protein n=1 Tax=Protea cynaroides TaxID=273540 RepID=A0A9Q0GQM2_9MAGN|nr:hypothetical protein NE237_028626 [Protea cynaroides]